MLNLGDGIIPKFKYAPFFERNVLQLVAIVERWVEFFYTLPHRLTCPLCLIRERMACRRVMELARGRWQITTYVSTREIDISLDLIKYHLAVTVGDSLCVDISLLTWPVQPLNMYIRTKMRERVDSCISKWLGGYIGTSIPPSSNRRFRDVMSDHLCDWWKSAVRYLIRSASGVER